MRNTPKFRQTSYELSPPASSLYRSTLLGQILVLGILLASFAGPVRANLESDLNHYWKGAWVVSQVSTASGCSGAYTNNEVRAGVTSSKGDVRFGKGELAQVHKVNLTRKRVEILIDLDEPVLISRQEGPFTLYDERHCKVELRLDVGSKRRDGDVEAAIEAVLERHTDVESATASDAWNGRQREPYPPDYDRTLAEYEAWQVFENNADVQATIEHSVDEAARILDRLSRDEGYLEGFSAGIAEARERSWSSDCNRVLSMSLISWLDRARKDASGEWKRGYEHAQKLVFHVERARRLGGCFVPPPVP